MTAHGDNPELHRIVDGRFVCTAPLEAPCRTYPDCSCESFGAEHTEDYPDHVDVPGQACWIGEWIDTIGVGDSYVDQEHVWLDGDWFPDGPVTADWVDGECIEWQYADSTRPRPSCSECGDPVRNEDPHTGWGMCASCLHDAIRSGWEPPATPRTGVPELEDPRQPALPLGGA